jgi:hypothetical protein
MVLPCCPSGRRTSSLVRASEMPWCENFGSERKRNPE